MVIHVRTNERTNLLGGISLNRTPKLKLRSTPTLSCHWQGYHPWRELGPGAESVTRATRGCVKLPKTSFRSSASTSDRGSCSFIPRPRTENFNFLYTCFRPLEGASVVFKPGGSHATRVVAAFVVLGWPKRANKQERERERERKRRTESPKADERGVLSRVESVFVPVCFLSRGQ